VRDNLRQAYWPVKHDRITAGREHRPADQMALPMSARGELGRSLGHRATTPPSAKREGLVAETRHHEWTQLRSDGLAGAFQMSESRKLAAILVSDVVSHSRIADAQGGFIGLRTPHGDLHWREARHAT
jgi:hypothetical protein